MGNSEGVSQGIGENSLQRGISPPTGKDLRKRNPDIQRRSGDSGAKENGEARARRHGTEDGVKEIGEVQAHGTLEDGANENGEGQDHGIGTKENGELPAHRTWAGVVQAHQIGAKEDGEAQAHRIGAQENGEVLLHGIEDEAKENGEHHDDSMSKLKASTVLELSAAERDAVYNRLIEEAPYIPGDTGEPCSVQDIPWLNPSLVSEGQRFIKNNFFALICAHLGALLYGFSFKRLSTVLMRTGKSHEVSDSMVRYLSTFVHFKDWYSDGIGTSGGGMNYNNMNNMNNNVTTIDQTFKDVQRIRAMHRHSLRKCLQTPLPSKEYYGITPEKLQVIQALTKDLQHIPTTQVPPEILTYDPRVTMSQFDMAMTQFGLIGLLYMFPVTLGVRDKRGLEGFLHLWAIFGKLLGIQDRFNIALYPDIQLYRRLFTNVGVASLKELDVRIFTLQKSLLDGFSKFTFFGSIKSFLFYGLYSKEALPAFEGTNLYKLLSWTDWFYYITFKCILTLYYQFAIFHQIVDFIAKFVVELYAKIHLKKREKLRRKFQQQLAALPQTSRN